MSQPELNPPSRFPDRPIERAEGHWWIAKVKSRQEKQLAFDFVKMGIEYYLPLYKKVYVRPGEKTRKRTFILPLFPSYIAFAQDTPHDIYKTGRVANLIEVRNQRQFIRELSQIYQTLESGYTVAPVDQPFELGTEVEITGGLLKGIRGRVAEIRSHQYLVITVSGLGRAIVKVEEAQMKTVKEDQE